MKNNKHKNVKAAGRLKQHKLTKFSNQEENSIMLPNELKFVDTQSLGSVTTTGLWTKITFPPQGLTSSDRVADRIVGLHLDLRGLLYMTGAINDSARIIVLQTKGLYTTPPATTDVLVSSTPQSHYVYNARETYSIVWDSYFSMSPTGDSSSRKVEKSVHLKIPHLKFISGSTNVYSGQIYMLVLSGNNANISYLINTRLWYEDS